jgi:hypothetical protein
VQPIRDSRISSLTSGQQRLLDALQQERDRERDARRLAEHRARAAEAKVVRMTRLVAVLSRQGCKPIA